MPVRKKSKFEQWFSFSRHQRRFGADKVYAQFNDVDLDKLKTTRIEGTELTYTHGSAKDLNEHIEQLKQEFVGQPQLNHYHASLIVLIRREVDSQNNYAKFKALWLAERDFLLRSLNIRWLISACDTFIDFDEDACLKATLMNAVVLINTLKLQETERFLCDQSITENPEHQQHLQHQRYALFDGTSAFAVGTDDTLRNMRWRLEQVCEIHPLGQIVIEIFDRLQRDENNNVYSRFKQRHTREKTRWW
ncbi:hypothetical protein [Acinetobacter indicus]|uniref:hypothetical protein n=1 Tax=Acinetobacter indicus TaxID=756892 RepID=UPI00143FD887|nr:hypothetical protein [Acinetobacter indicus]NOJ66741.1 hypothetical protein [Acinetobacter indicus]QIZ62607.1 hypothetical protein FK538_11720 [Acinetobacter indicus]